MNVLRVFTKVNGLKTGWIVGQVAIPDHLVGVILGKAGATVIDMQNQTGARIQVSQRGEYLPGTTNR